MAYIYACVCVCVCVCIPTCEMTSHAEIENSIAYVSSPTTILSCRLIRPGDLSSPIGSVSGKEGGRKG